VSWVNLWAAEVSLQLWHFGAHQCTNRHKLRTKKKGCKFQCCLADHVTGKSPPGAHL